MSWVVFRWAQRTVIASETLLSSCEMYISSPHPQGVTYCRDNQFTCNNGRCLAQDQQCDGVLDCVEDASDEIGCPTRYPDSSWCSSRQFTCNNTVRHFFVESHWTRSRKSISISFKLEVLYWTTHVVNIQHYTCTRTLTVFFVRHVVLI